MNEQERISAFRQAKKEYLDFLTRVLWQLSDSRERFVQSMHCALFGLWRQVDKVTGPETFKVLYHIALSANALAWRETLPTAQAPPTSRHAQTHKEIGQAVRKAIAELPLEQSETVAMRYIGGKNVREIASTLGLSKDEAERHINQAVETLKRKVAG
jgi:RNA polymerase sigma factor (sigma-70 family)